MMFMNEHLNQNALAFFMRRVLQVGGAYSFAVTTHGGSVQRRIAASAYRRCIRALTLRITRAPSCTA
jgi:hypothetical protein